MPTQSPPKKGNFSDPRAGNSTKARTDVAKNAANPENRNAERASKQPRRKGSSLTRDNAEIVRYVSESVESLLSNDLSIWTENQCAVLSQAILESVGDIISGTMSSTEFTEAIQGAVEEAGESIVVEGTGSNSTNAVDLTPEPVKEAEPTGPVLTNGLIQKFLDKIRADKGKLFASVLSKISNVFHTEKDARIGQNQPTEEVEQPAQLPDVPAIPTTKSSLAKATSNIALPFVTPPNPQPKTAVMSPSGLVVDVRSPTHSKGVIDVNSSYLYGIGYTLKELRSGIRFELEKIEKEAKKDVRSSSRKIRKPTSSLVKKTTPLEAFGKRARAAVEDSLRVSGKVFGGLAAGAVMGAASAVSSMAKAAASSVKGVYTAGKKAYKIGVKASKILVKGGSKLAKMATRGLGRAIARALMPKGPTSDTTLKDSVVSKISDLKSKIKAFSVKNLVTKTVDSLKKFGNKIYFKLKSRKNRKELGEFGSAIYRAAADAKDQEVREANISWSKRYGALAATTLGSLGKAISVFRKIDENAIIGFLRFLFSPLGIALMLTPLILAFGKRIIRWISEKAKEFLSDPVANLTKLVGTLVGTLTRAWNWVRAKGEVVVDWLAKATAPGGFFDTVNRFLAMTLKIGGIIFGELFGRKPREVVNNLCAVLAGGIYGLVYLALKKSLKTRIKAYLRIQFAALFFMLEKVGWLAKMARRYWEVLKEIWEHPFWVKTNLKLIGSLLAETFSPGKSDPPPVELEPVSDAAVNANKDNLSLLQSGTGKFQYGKELDSELINGLHSETASARLSKMMKFFDSNKSQAESYDEFLEEAVNLAKVGNRATGDAMRNVWQALLSNQELCDKLLSVFFYRDVVTGDAKSIVDKSVLKAIVDRVRRDALATDSSNAFEMGKQFFQLFEDLNFARKGILRKQNDYISSQFKAIEDYTKYKRELSKSEEERAAELAKIPEYLYSRNGAARKNPEYVKKQEESERLKENAEAGLQALSQTSAQDLSETIKATNTGNLAFGKNAQSVLKFNEEESLAPQKSRILQEAAKEANVDGNGMDNDFSDVAETQSDDSGEQNELASALSMASSLFGGMRKGNQSGISAPGSLVPKALPTSVSMPEFAKRTIEGMESDDVSPGGVAGMLKALFGSATSSSLTPEQEAKINDAYRTELDRYYSFRREYPQYTEKELEDKFGVRYISYASFREKYLKNTKLSMLDEALHPPSYDIIPPEDKARFHAKIASDLSNHGVSVANIPQQLDVEDAKKLEESVLSTATTIWQVIEGLVVINKSLEYQSGKLKKENEAGPDVEVIRANTANKAAMPSLVEEPPPGADF